MHNVGIQFMKVVMVIIVLKLELMELYGVMEIAN
jgi:hypothetical protein